MFSESFAIFFMVAAAGFLMCCDAYYSGRYGLCCCRRCGSWFYVAIVTGAGVFAAVFAVIIAVAVAVMVVLIFG